jgi:hypothetical protein
LFSGACSPISIAFALMAESLPAVASPCFCYRFKTLYGIVRFMKKSLLETNSYLKDPAQRKRLIRRSVVSSFAIEGIFLKEETDRCVKEDSPAFKDRTTSTSER